MKFTLGWLKEYLDTSASVTEVGDKLTALGLEVEGIHDAASALAAFTVAKVLEAKPHPNADKLRVCTVETASGIVEVVCGAPNARTGMKAVYAPIGATIPVSGDVLKKAKIRGVESNGMLVSERELGLSDEHEGIIELPEGTPLGAPFATVRGLDDPLIEIAITPNRQDCLGVHGVARDLAAPGLGRLKPLTIRSVPGKFASPLKVALQFDANTAAACPYFVGRYVRGVKNGPSPEWLQRRLRAIGLRPISALVDMTNFMAFAFARPLHVFDADTVAGALHVRLSRPGETLAALNGKTYELDGEVTVIADTDGPLAMGGVIGGEASGCTAETKNVFIESALFDPLRTAATGRRYQIESDARYRFERGVDPEFVVAGIEEATRLVQELCGGEASELVIAGAVPAWRRSYDLRPTRVASLGGLDLPEVEIKHILTALGCTVEPAGIVLKVTPPSWRRDIDGEADLVEEVVRVHGLNAIRGVPLPPLPRAPGSALTVPQRRVRTAKRALAARGLMEAVTFSFLPSKLAGHFGGGQPELILVNPISADLDAMRPSLLPNLLTAVGRNLNRGLENPALFEVGPTYANDTPEGQSRVAAAVRQGTIGARHWSGPQRPLDAYDAKADALAVLEACGAAIATAQVVAGAPPWYHPGRSGTVRLGPKAVLAYFGELHPGVLRELDIRGPVVAFEVFLDAIPLPKAKGTNRPKLNAPDLLAVERDFAFVVDAAVDAADLVRAAEKADPLVAAVSVFDVFAGKGVAEGKKSIAIAVRLQPVTATLTDAEIEAVAARIVAAVVKATGAALRA